MMRALVEEYRELEVAASTVDEYSYDADPLRKLRALAAPRAGRAAPARKCHDVLIPRNTIYLPTELELPRSVTVGRFLTDSTLSVVSRGNPLSEQKAPTSTVLATQFTASVSRLGLPLEASVGWRVRGAPPWSAGGGRPLNKKTKGNRMIPTPTTAIPSSAVDTSDVTGAGRRPASASHLLLGSNDGSASIASAPQFFRKSSAPKPMSAGARRARLGVCLPMPVDGGGSARRSSGASLPVGSVCSCTLSEASFN